MLVKLHIDRLVMLHIHEMERRASRPDHLQIDLVGWVVETAEFSIVDAESILPDMKDALLCLRISRPSSSLRVWDASAFNAITTKGVAGAVEA